MDVKIRTSKMFKSTLIFQQNVTTSMLHEVNARAWIPLKCIIKIDRLSHKLNLEWNYEMIAGVL